VRLYVISLRTVLWRWTMQATNSVWNSLEVVKLAVALLTPVLVLWLGYQVGKVTSRLKAAQWANQKVVEKRITVFDQVAPVLNDLYCYFAFVGNWKELTPPEMVRAKRTLDKAFYIYAPLFSRTFVQRYHSFIRECFETYAGVGHDARLRTPIESGDGDRRQLTSGWDANWQKLFSPNPSRKDDMKRAYDDLRTGFSNELGLGLVAR
jgi:hypothetical protein